MPTPPDPAADAAGVTPSGANSNGSDSAADADPIRVRAAPRRAFESADFDPDHDKFKSVLVVPRSTFDRLFPGDEASGYVRAQAVGGDRTVTLYVRPFGGRHRAETTDDRAEATEDRVEATDDPAEAAPPVAYLRANRQRDLGLDGAADPVIELDPVDARDVGPLDVVRYSTLTESTRVDECRVHPSDLADVGVDDRADVEVYNPATGGRIRLTAVATPDVGEGCISLSTRARKLLRAEFEERAGEETVTSLHVRRPHPASAGDGAVDGGAGIGDDRAASDGAGTDGEQRAGGDDRGPLARLREAVFDWAVDHHEIRLRVHLGLNTDEGRSTVRVAADTMEVLGIDEGDRVVIESETGRTTARARSVAPDSHYVETDEDIDEADVRDRTVLLPATERERSGAVVDDVVRVRRDTTHVAIKRIVPSLFGFFAVFIGGVQTIDLIFPPAWKLPAVGATLLLSTCAIWLVLWPERQRCR